MSDSTIKVVRTFEYKAVVKKSVHVRLEHFLEQCWGEFVSQLEYKCECAGGQLIRLLQRIRHRSVRTVEANLKQE